MNKHQRDEILAVADTLRKADEEYESMVVPDYSVNPKTHNLKIERRYFEKILSGEKTFEIRRNDRNFMVSDTIRLKEIGPLSKLYTGRELSFKISYITDYKQRSGYVVMAIGCISEIQVTRNWEVAFELEQTKEAEDERR